MKKLSKMKVKEENIINAIIAGLIAGVVVFLSWVAIMFNYGFRGQEIIEASSIFDEPRLRTYVEYDFHTVWESKSKNVKN